MNPGGDFSAQSLAVGHATDFAGGTGLTVIRGINSPFRAAAAIIGRATSTRQFDALSPTHIVGRVDAVLFSGGSAFGLDSAAGVMRWMEERGRGFPVGATTVPIVPTAVLFDLGPLGTPLNRPTPQMAYDACNDAVSSGFLEGSAGAGTGATVGKAGGIDRCMKGGLGCATESGGRLTVTALVVVNAYGNVHDASGNVLAGSRNDSGGFLDARHALASGEARSRFREHAGSNTTLALVAVSSPMSRLELQQLASAASAALFRRISPVGTAVDGDVVIAVSPLSGESSDPMAAEALAVAALERGVERAVTLATGTASIPSHADLIRNG